MTLPKGFGQSTPLRCKIGKHSWTSPNANGVKTCKICRKINDTRPKRCKIDYHTWEKNQEGIKVCRHCKRDYDSWESDSLWSGGGGA